MPILNTDLLVDAFIYEHLAKPAPRAAAPTEQELEELEAELKELESEQARCMAPHSGPQFDEDGCVYCGFRTP